MSYKLVAKKEAKRSASLTFYLFSSNYLTNSIKYEHNVRCNFLFFFQGHLKEGYGRLISAYTMLLNQKLIFHRKVSLADKDSDSISITHNTYQTFTADNIFKLCCFFKIGECSGSVVECLIRDRGVAGSSLTSCTELCL